MVVGALLVFVVLAVWLMNSGKPNGGNGKKSVPAVVSTNWDDPYELMSKDANGLYLFNYFLKAHLNKGPQVSKIDHRYSLDTLSRMKQATFVFIGEQFVLNPQEADSLLAHVARGSKAFLAQHIMDPYLYNALFDNIELSYEYHFSTRIKAGKYEYPFTYQYQNDTIANKWRGFKNILLSEDTTHKVLSTIGKLENNIAIPYGKGWIYLSPNPEIYVNYQLKQNSGFYYARTWLSRIPTNEDVYWLELGRFKELPEYEPDDFFEEEEGERDDSYLQFIFQNPNRVIAIVLLLVGVLFYVLFRAKRTQPVVPFIGKKKNMTLVFADTITSIYFADRNSYVMLNVQKRNFFNAVQKHFYVDLSKRKDDREIKALSQKSNIPEAEIQELINGFETKEVSAVNEHYLIDMARKQVSFYRRAGMISNRVQEKIESREFRLFRNIWISALLLLLGLCSILLGFYFLVKAVGVGILLWPLGIVMLAFAVLRMSKPLLRVDKESMRYYPLFGKSKGYEISEINAIETSDSGTKFRFNGGKMLIINYWELNHMDAQQFKRFVAVQNKLKL